MNKFVRVLILNICFVLFGLCAVASGTYAWFATSHSVTTEAGAFTIDSPSGATFSLYYLDYFWDSDINVPTGDGNFDTGVNLNCGYETEQNKASFAHITCDEQGNASPVLSPVEWNPTAISDLWPAHQLTFAIVITSGSFGGFKLDTWAEQTSENVLATPLEEGGENEVVHLAWAISIYGHAYHLTPSAQSQASGGIQTAYAQYHYDRTHTHAVTDPEDQNSTIQVPNCPDRFPFSQDNPVSHDPLSIIGSQEVTDVPIASSETEQTLLFFTIEFSNESDTFYSLVSEGLYERDSSGNSNCYENLQLTNMSFSLL